MNESTMRTAAILSRKRILIAAGLLLVTLTANAHHSFGGTYDVRKSVKIEGQIVQISLRMPHSFIYVETTEADGSVRRWAVEGAGASQFAQQGISAANPESFQVLDPVVIVANPARTQGSTRVRLLTITRTTDGRSWGDAAGEIVD
jgi:hypothetical protein